MVAMTGWIMKGNVGLSLKSCVIRYRYKHMVMVMLVCKSAINEFDKKSPVCVVVRGEYPHGGTNRTYKDGTLLSYISSSELPVR
jgi:hypothetical protein